MVYASQAVPAFTARQRLELKSLLNEMANESIRKLEERARTTRPLKKYCEPPPPHPAALP